MSVQPVEPTGGGSHFHQAVQLLTRRSGRAAKIAQALLVGAAVHELADKAWRKGRDATIYSVSVPGEDDVYDDVQTWLVANLPPKRRRALTARTKRRTRHDEPMLAESGMGKPPPKPLVSLFYDGTKSQTVTIEGHRVQVTIERAERQTGGRLTEQQMADIWLDRETMIFRCSGTSARDAVLRLVDSIAQAREEQTVHRFYIPRYGSWNRRNDLPPRRLDTVVLRHGQREGIAGDLADFLDAEQRYSRIGLPWHRGYVFHGPPGTGKTSLAKALAEHFELDLYFIPLSDVESDTNLLQLFSQVDPRSMLVLEDIDIVHGAKTRDDADTQKAVSLSGLLNSLDGLATPHGLVTVMTTNDISVIDHAMLRPGRADRIEELGWLDKDQLDRLLHLIIGNRRTYTSIEPQTVAALQLTHAEIIEAAKPYLDRPADAAAAIGEYVHERAARLSQRQS